MDKTKDDEIRFPGENLERKKWKNSIFLLLLLYCIVALISALVVPFEFTINYFGFVFGFPLITTFTGFILGMRYFLRSLPSQFLIKDNTLMMILDDVWDPVFGKIPLSHVEYVIDRSHMQGINVIKKQFVYSKYNLVLTDGKVIGLQAFTANLAKEFSSLLGCEFR